MTYALGQGSGPLKGVKVVEIAGIGPGPHACMLLADLGADVVRIDRPGGNPLSAGENDLLNRGRPSVALDLKRPEAVATVLDLVERLVSSTTTTQVLSSRTSPPDLPASSTVSGALWSMPSLPTLVLNSSVSPLVRPRTHARPSLARSSLPSTGSCSSTVYRCSS